MTDQHEVTVDAAWLRAGQHHLTSFHDLLATEGLKRGLIGPREVPRLWPRHLLNCLCVADPGIGLLTSGDRVADLGTGAGLPGLVWALVRPDVAVTLVEPLQRRTSFLQEAVTTLGLADRVNIVQARAQDVPGLAQDVVTSRALAPLAGVVEWSLPHVRPGGALLAIKGGKASTELSEARETISQMGGVSPAIIRIGPVDDDGHPLATVVRVLKGGT